MEERALIFRLLKGRFPSLDTAQFSERCRGAQASKASWKWALEQHEQIDGIRELQDVFLDALESDEHLKLPRIDAESIAIAAERERPSRLMGSLRTALATAALQEIHPDLIIFDEFQKFRKLLIDLPNVSPDPVTRALRGSVHRNGPALLMLSATPYRPYSSRQEEAAGFSHHQDFLELIRIPLFGSRAGDAAKDIRSGHSAISERRCSRRRSPTFLSFCASFASRLRPKASPSGTESNGAPQ